jgi:predicted TIM-barrel fold metal-dependent hydrolase
MFINSHAHVFNARSLFNRATLEILLKRVPELKLGIEVRKILIDQIEKAVENPDKLPSSEFFFENMIRKLVKTSSGKKLMGRLSKASIKNLGLENLDKLAANGLAAMMNALRGLNKEWSEEESITEAEEQNVADFFEFLAILFQPSIRQVTRNLFNQLPSKSRDGVIALTLDITKDGDDNGQYQKQVDDTAEMVYDYPGRLFPFFSVNPKRNSALGSDVRTMMEHALTRQGYVGVKLYPATGYKIDRADMKPIFQYCSERRVPMLVHCNKGGFTASKEWVKQSDPAVWVGKQFIERIGGDPAIWTNSQAGKGILERHNDLAICFGHFGGPAPLAGVPDEDPWFEKILVLMEHFPHVYADISYHTTAMEQPALRPAYFRNLAKLIDHPVYGDRILWGTDYMLVRQQLKETSHWAYFRKYLSKTRFAKIAETNPIRFLGLEPEPTLPPFAVEGRRWTIGNYVANLYNNRDIVSDSTLPQWLRAAVKARYGVGVKFEGTPLGRRWKVNNPIHAAVHRAFITTVNTNMKKSTHPFASSGEVLIQTMNFWRIALKKPDMKKELKVTAIRLVKQIEDTSRDVVVRRKKASNGKRYSRLAVQNLVTNILKDPNTMVADVAGKIERYYEVKGI